MLKVGSKKLFIRDDVGNIKEIEPLCVLDFYVHESCQRIRYGKFLFETMCENEKVEPHKIGYDRPSSKLLNFLKKHYNLETYTPQVNNFVVYNIYFIGDKSFKAYFKVQLLPRDNYWSFYSIQSSSSLLSSRFLLENMESPRGNVFLALYFLTSLEDFLRRYAVFPLVAIK